MASDLEAFFRKYAELFMNGSPEAVADLYVTPAVAVRAGSPVPLPTRAAIVEHLRTLMAGIRATGAAAAEVTGIEALSQGDSALLATVHWQLRSADGAPVRDFRTSYQLAGASDWRIISYVNHDMLRAR